MVEERIKENAIEAEVQPQIKKKIFTLQEMLALGYPIRYLYAIVKDSSQNFAFREYPENPKSKYLFDMERFEKWRDKQIKLSR